jgi:hypothetical protein
MMPGKTNKNNSRQCKDNFISVKWFSAINHPVCLPDHTGNTQVGEKDLLKGSGDQGAGIREKEGGRRAR